MKLLTTEEFIERAKSVHGDKYDYSKTVYKKSTEKVCIICPIHGEFWQTPKIHLNGFGCSKCSHKHSYTTMEWIELAKKVHGDKYDYTKVEYKNAFKKVCIICPKHGEFWQTPNGHLNGDGCPKCFLDKQRKTTEEFIEKARQIHGNMYDYSKTNYINSRTKVCIICPTHGEFWQIPSSHLNGRGCPVCKRSHLENIIYKLLEENNITYTYQKRFKWLGLQSLDFYLQDYDIAIECQGIQHFKPKGFGTHKSILERFKKDQQRDNLKIQKCKENNIKLIHYVPFEKYFGTYENEVHNIEELKKLLIKTLIS